MKILKEKNSKIILSYEIFSSLSWWISLFYINNFIFWLTKKVESRIVYFIIGPSKPKGRTSLDYGMGSGENKSIFSPKSLHHGEHAILWFPNHLPSESETNSLANSIISMCSRGNIVSSDYLFISLNFKKWKHIINWKFNIHSMHPVSVNKIVFYMFIISIYLHIWYIICV